ncbi:MFS transporter [Sorangium sp. So ce726]|uniref:MFS transporter n=1 Tax=Sorangium sp. So ce726 TaxID=3133319 RepID=UPI003F5F55AB
MSASSRTLTTVGLALGLFLAALESTVVATAMPTVIGELGGHAWYALPFAVYMLSMTVTSPLWGRASDRLGRRRLYLFGVFLFLAGSALSGAAGSMLTLIAGRVVQGLGAGALGTLTFAIVGELYPLKERSRIQGMLSGVWGLSGLIGPLVGGLLVDHASWRWVFYLNMPFGLIGAAFVGRFLEESPIPEKAAPLDLAGAALFTAGSGALVWGLEARNWPFLVAGVVVLAWALRIESRHPAPLLPLRLLQARLPRVAVIGNFLAGAAFFGTVSYLPLYAQGVARTGATAAGLLLTPMVLGWTLASMSLGTVLPRLGVPRLARLGAGLLVAAFAGFVALTGAPLPLIGACGFVAGTGMGAIILSLLVGAQECTPRQELGALTAVLMFARSLGGGLGVTLMGALIGDTEGVDPTDLARGLRFAFVLGLAFVALGLAFVAQLRAADLKRAAEAA